MMLNESVPAKVLVNADDYSALLRAAQSALDFLKSVQADLDEPFSPPWPEIDALEQAVLDNLKKEEL